VLGRLRPATDWLAPLAADTGSEAFGAGHWETTARRADGSTFPVELKVSRTEVDGWGRSTWRCSATTPSTESRRSV
jgi:hypothetical protein